ncbi:hypothetical protein FOA52_001639 [Chlamydomonas sp. UWO 241]|nr:hypothetical protein FOA52_001639 [Chlamydomonas sp. UWO 241]
MTSLYTESEAASLSERVPALMEMGEAMRSRLVEPTLERLGRISATVFAFVEEYKRKVYGGHALDAAFAALNTGERVYATDEIRAAADIEFYSPDPIADIKTLCNRLHADGHPFVQAKEAAHNGTFTISVSFARVCDVTYMPNRVYNSIPVLPSQATTNAINAINAINATNTTNITNITTVHPHVALVDLLRMLCDPATSYWRLDRMLPRLLKLQQLYPLAARHTRASADPSADNTKADKTAAVDPVRYDAVHAHITRIFDWAKTRRDNIALIAHGAAASYRAETESSAIAALAARVCLGEMREITFVCVDYDDDVASATAALGMGGGPADVKRFNPFMDMMGARTDIRTRDSRRWLPNLSLIGANGRVVPCVVEPAGAARGDGAVRVATFEYVVMNTLAMVTLAQTRSIPAIEVVYRTLLHDLLCAKHLGGGSVGGMMSALTTGNVDYIGTAVSDMHSHLEARNHPSHPSRRGWMTYTPARGHVSGAAVFPVCDGAPIHVSSPVPTGGSAPMPDSSAVQHASGPSSSRSGLLLASRDVSAVHCASGAMSSTEQELMSSDVSPVHSASGPMSDKSPQELRSIDVSASLIAIPFRQYIELELAFIDLRRVIPVIQPMFSISQELKFNDVSDGIDSDSLNTDWSSQELTSSDVSDSRAARDSSLRRKSPMWFLWL